MVKKLLLDHVNSPIGPVLIVTDGDQLCSLDFADYEQRMMTLLQRRYGPVQLTMTTDPCGFSSQVRSYFAGDYHCLDTIPVSTGGTPFQQQGRLALRTIPPGKTTTYGQLAAKLGKPTPDRAVAGTHARNPVAM